MVTDCAAVYVPVPGLKEGGIAVGEAPFSNPYADTAPWLPMNTLPSAMVGVVNLTALPGTSRVFGAWLLL